MKYTRGFYRPLSLSGILVLVITFLVVTVHTHAMQRISMSPESFHIEFLLPRGYRFNSLAPSSLLVGTTQGASEQLEVKNQSFDSTLSVPAKAFFTLSGEARVFFCEDLPQPQCFMKKIKFEKSFDIQTPRVLQIDIPNPKGLHSDS